MKLDADQVIKTIDDQKFATRNKKVRQTTLSKHPQTAFKALVAFIKRQIKKKQLGQANLQVTGTKMVISLEINVINMPYSSIRPLKRLITNEGVMDAHVYVMMSDPQLNRSKFRIDEVALTDDFIKSNADDLAKLQEWLTKQLKQLKAYQERLAKIPKATKRAKKARRSRRTSKKRRTARKRKTTRRKRK